MEWEEEENLAFAEALCFAEFGMRGWVRDREDVE